jgi:hypothetical protein
LSHTILTYNSNNIRVFWMFPAWLCQHVIVCSTVLPWAYCYDILHLAGTQHHGCMCSTHVKCGLGNNASFKDMNVRIILYFRVSWT